MTREEQKAANKARYWKRREDNRCTDCGAGLQEGEEATHGSGADVGVGVQEHEPIRRSGFPKGRPDCVVVAGGKASVVVQGNDARPGAQALGVDHRLDLAGGAVTRSIIDHDGTEAWQQGKFRAQ